MNPPTKGKLMILKSERITLIVKEAMSNGFQKSEDGVLVTLRKESTIILLQEDHEPVFILNGVVLSHDQMQTIMNALTQSLEKLFDDLRQAITPILQTLRSRKSVLK